MNLSKSTASHLFDQVFDLSVLVHEVQRRLAAVETDIEAIDESVYLLRAADRLFNLLNDDLNQLCIAASEVVNPISADLTP